MTRRETLTAADGQSIGYEVRESAGATTVVVFLPAIGVPLGYYDKFLDAWAGTGVHVVGVELRGMPQSPAEGDFGYHDMLRYDLPAVFQVDEVRRADRVILAGHSLGGVLALLATGAGIVEPQAVVTIATASVWHRGIVGLQGRAQRWAVVRIISLITRVLGYWPGDRLGFAGRQPRSMMTDWAYEGRYGRYYIHGDNFDYESALSKISVPVLMLGIAGDQWFGARAMALLADRVPTSQQQIVNARTAAGHVNWARRIPSEVLAAIAAWKKG